jgi:hypothetical protein
MKRFKIIAITWAALFSIPFAAIAMDDHVHDSHGQENKLETHHHDQVKHDDHGGTQHMNNENAEMISDGSMIIVGSQVSKGVKGMAHLNDVSETMAKMGMKTTHHFMIAFVDEATGEKIENGTVALKITNPDAKVGETVKLAGMGGHFGADVPLDIKGEYHFKLATKLADGKNRKYHFHQVIK